jgi:hypothetical protein
MWLADTNGFVIPRKRQQRRSCGLDALACGSPYFINKASVINFTPSSHASNIKAWRWDIVRWLGKVGADAQTFVAAGGCEIL